MKALKIQKSPDDAIKDIITYLFEHKKISGVFTLVRKSENDFVYALVTDKQMVNRMVPTYPFMPMNAGKLISRFTMVTSPRVPIVVVLKPCELRALYELVKLEQARLDNLLFLSFTCNGVFSTKAKNNGLEKKVKEYWEEARNCEPVKGLRETCTMCDDFVPDNADVVVALVGENSTQETNIIIRTEKAQDYLQGMSGQASEQNLESKNIDTLRRKRLEQRKVVNAGLKTEELGWNGLINLFGRCISCHACSSVCPVCYCTLCYIDSSQKDISVSDWERQLMRWGSVRIPDDTVMYHLVRMTHVGIMCVGCGMCSDICPVGIPIASIIAKFGKRVQKNLDYNPGKDLEQKNPLAFVKPEDFVESTPEEE